MIVGLPGKLGLKVDMEIYYLYNSKYKDTRGNPPYSWRRPPRKVPAIEPHAYMVSIQAGPKAKTLHMSLTVF